MKRSSAGLGLFAATDFKKGDFVIEYTGKIITNEEADKKCGKYLFNIGPRYTIDGTGRENLGRYLNHCCRPNCEAVLDGRRVFLYAKRPIKSGEELTYDYGKEYFDEFIRPHGCRCQACCKK